MTQKISAKLLKQVRDQQHEEEGTGESNTNKKVAAINMSDDDSELGDGEDIEVEDMVMSQSKVSHSPHLGPR